MSLIICKINVIPNWSANCFIRDAPVKTQAQIFTNIYRTLCSKCKFINSR